MSDMTVTDLFCGAGGSSTGAVNAGATVRMALNHWKLAIETHNTNHPNADHDCTDVQTCDPRRYPSTTILIASPECFPSGTLILTKGGIRPIESVRVGDLVLTHRGRWQPVIAVMKTIRDTVLVRGQGHRSLEVSAEHPFYIRRQTRQWNNVRRDYDRRILSEPEWIRAGDLGTNAMRWATPCIFPSLPIPKVFGENARFAEFSPAFWWMIGRWLGDGTVRIRDDGSSEVTICCGKHEVGELAQGLAFAPRQGSHAKRGEMHWRQREIRTSYLFECTHDGLARWINEHFAKGAHHKTIPSWVLGMPRDWRIALLDGYVSADGSKTTRYTSIASVSKKLALGIRLIATSLGYHATFGKYRHKQGMIEGRPFNAYDLWIVRWENNRSQRTGVIDGLHAWTLVKGVTEGNQGVEVYNLSVAEDESYVADGIVVHNCTNHSLAKGVKRPTRQISMLENGQPDPAAERSRATMWDVVRFTEHHQYKVVIVENVPDARQWILYDAWLKAMHDLGYAHKEVFLNSMFVWPTPQSRDRMYVVFWRKGNRAPVLDYHPVAHCECCTTNVRAVQVWKNLAKPFGKYKAQYRYLCPRCANVVQPFYFCAANAIDWSLPITRIADRKRPLKEKTMARIRYGLEKYANHPFAPNALLMMNYSPGYCKPITEPTGAITTSDHHSLLIPMGYTHEAHDRRSTTSAEPLPTQSTRQELGVCIPPFMVSPNHSDLRATTVLDAMPTQTAGWNQGLVMPFIAELHNHSTARGVDQALATVCASGGHHAVVQPFITSYYGSDTTNHQSDALGTVTTRDHHAVVVPPFTVSYYGGDGDHRTNDLGKALPTVPGMAVHYLAQPQTPSVDDCGFRMLQPHEVGAAMAFPREYVVLGNARELVKQYGNAVTPPVMQWLVGQVMTSLS